MTRIFSSTLKINSKHSIYNNVVTLVRWKAIFKNNPLKYYLILYEFICHLIHRYICHIPLKSIRDIMEKEFYDPFL